MAETGNGGALTLTNFSSDVITIDFSGFEIESLDSSHLGTTTYRTFVPGDLVNAGTIEFEFFYNPDMTTKIGSLIGVVDSAIVVDFPVGTQGTDATLTASGFPTSLKPGNLENDTLSRGTGTIQMDGNAAEPAFANSSV